jgi:hypothetical protein
MLSCWIVERGIRKKNNLNGNKNQWNKKINRIIIKWESLKGKLLNE